MSRRQRIQREGSRDAVFRRVDTDFIMREIGFPRPARASSCILSRRTVFISSDNYLRGVHADVLVGPVGEAVEYGHDIDVGGREQEWEAGVEGCEEDDCEGGEEIGGYDVEVPPVEGGCVDG